MPEHASTPRPEPIHTAVRDQDYPNLPDVNSTYYEPALPYAIPFPSATREWSYEPYTQSHPPAQTRNSSGYQYHYPQFPSPVPASTAWNGPTNHQAHIAITHSQHQPYSTTARSGYPDPLPHVSAAASQHRQFSETGWDGSSEYRPYIPTTHSQPPKNPVTVYNGSSNGHLHSTAAHSQSMPDKPILRADEPMVAYSTKGPGHTTEGFKVVENAANNGSIRNKKNTRTGKEATKGVVKKKEMGSSKAIDCGPDGYNKQEVLNALRPGHIPTKEEVRVVKDAVDKGYKLSDKDVKLLKRAIKSLPKPAKKRHREGSIDLKTLSSPVHREGSQSSNIPTPATLQGPLPYEISPRIDKTPDGWIPPSSQEPRSHRTAQGNRALAPPGEMVPSGTQANPYVLDSSPSPKSPGKRQKLETGTAVHSYEAGKNLGCATGLYEANSDYEQRDYAKHEARSGTPHTYDSQPVVQIAEVEPTLCKEQADLVDLIMSGRNVFYTGSAGCGKSTVLKAFVKRLTAQGKIVQILAPTGRAALSVNGTTTWSYLGWVPDHHQLSLEKLLQKAEGKVTWKRLNQTDVIVIDEISMVENLHFERMNAFLKRARGNNKAFGGVQMVVTGDFCQLPPVLPFRHCIHCGRELIEKKSAKEYKCSRHGIYYDSDKWAFRSTAWKECNFAHVNLTNIHRQSDKTFIDILQKMRIGTKLSRADMELLLNHPTKGINANAIKLFGSRAEVDRVNAERFAKLRSKPRSYRSLDSFKWNEAHTNLENKGRRAPNGALLELEEKEHRYKSRVELKQGMAVVLLANLNIKVGLVNGAQGVIQGFEKYNPDKMPKAGIEFMGQYSGYREEEVQSFIDQAECKEWPVVRFNNGLCRTIFADCTVNEYGDRDITPYTLLSRTQIPLMPGYAITTHKSQGMTLDKVEVDLSRTFEAGQAYVALSRARSLEGLKVVSFPPNAQMDADPQVKEFLQTAFPSDFKPSDWNS